MYSIGEYYRKPNEPTRTFLNETWLPGIIEQLEQVGIENATLKIFESNKAIENSNDALNNGLPSWLVPKGTQRMRYYGRGTYIFNSGVVSSLLYFTRENWHYCIGYFMEGYGNNTTELFAFMVNVNKNEIKYGASASEYENRWLEQDKFQKTLIVNTENSFFFNYFEQYNNFRSPFMGASKFEKYDGEFIEFIALTKAPYPKPSIENNPGLIMTSIIKATGGMYSSQLGDQFINKSPICNLLVGYSNYGYYGKCTDLCECKIDPGKSLFNIINMGGELYSPFFLVESIDSESSVWVKC